MFYISLFDVKLSEDDLKKIKTCQSISELHMKVYFYICPFICIYY